MRGQEDCVNYLLSLLCNEACYSSIKCNTSGLTFDAENNICILGKSCTMIDKLTLLERPTHIYRYHLMLFTLINTIQSLSAPDTLRSKHFHGILSLFHWLKLGQEQNKTCFALAPFRARPKIRKSAF